MYFIISLFVAICVLAWVSKPHSFWPSSKPGSAITKALPFFFFHRADRWVWRFEFNGSYCLSDFTVLKCGDIVVIYATKLHKPLHFGHYQVTISIKSCESTSGSDYVYCKWLGSDAYKTLGRRMLVLCNTLTCQGTCACLIWNLEGGLEEVGRSRSRQFCWFSPFSYKCCWCGQLPWSEVAWRHWEKQVVDDFVASPPLSSNCYVMLDCSVCKLLFLLFFCHWKNWEIDSLVTAAQSIISSVRNIEQAVAHYHYQLSTSYQLLGRLG